MDAYRVFFLAHAAFVARALEPGVDSKGDTYEAGESWHAFISSPTFQGDALIFAMADLLNGLERWEWQKLQYGEIIH